MITLDETAKFSNLEILFLREYRWVVVRDPNDFFAEDKSMQIIMTENIGPQLSTTVMNRGKDILPIF
jgi:hypothetical protein